MTYLEFTNEGLFSNGFELLAQAKKSDSGNLSSSLPYKLSIEKINFRRGL